MTTTLKSARRRPEFVAAGVALGLCVAGCTPAPPPPGVVAEFAGGRVELDEVGTIPRPVDDPRSNWRLEQVRDLAIRKSLLAEFADEPVSPEVEVVAEQARRDAMIRVLRQQLGWESVEVSDEEVRRHFESRRDLYEQVPELRLQHIYLRADRDRLSAGEIAAVRERAEEIRSEVVSGADFSAIARRSSESETAPSGGFLTLHSTDRVPQPFADAAWRLEDGEVSDVVEVENGFHVIKLRQRLGERKREFDEVRTLAAQRTRKEKLSALERAWVDEVGPSYGLERSYSILDDPFVDTTAALIRDRTGVFTVADLAAGLPGPLIEHFYQGYHPRIYEFLDQVVLNRLLSLEAEKRELADRDDVVAAVERAREEAKYQSILTRLLQERAERIPDDELQEFFWQNEARYKTLRRIDLTLIHLPLEKGRSLWGILRQGEEIADRIRGGESMEALAREYSRHYSAAVGGHYYQLTDSEMGERVQSSARFRRQFEALEPGGIAVLRSECYDSGRLGYVDTGVLIFRLDGITPPSQKSFEEVRQLVRANYLRRHYREMVGELRDEFIDKIDLVVFEDRLAED